MPSDTPPPRPRRERPLVAAGRERRPAVAASSEPLTVYSAPTGAAIRTDALFASIEGDVRVTFEGPRQQARGKVALRGFMAIPHFVWLQLVNTAAPFVAFVAWCAALVTGEVPKGMAEFLRLAIRYQARVVAYGVLVMHDRFPSFDLYDEHDPIEVEATPPKLNRAALLFRVVLMVPSVVVAWLASVGGFVCAPIGWLLALVLGRQPLALWQANAAALRYTTQAYAFAFMLTPQQPRGLFGDRDAPVLADGTPALPAQPRVARLALNPAARRIVIGFIAGAAVIYGGIAVSGISATFRVAQGYERVDDRHATLDRAQAVFRSEVPACNNDLPCLRSSSLRLADAYKGFRADVADVSFPIGAAPDDLISAAGRAESVLRIMARSESTGSYANSSIEFERAYVEFEREYNEFAGEEF